MSVIEISHITKDYGQGRGVFDVSFSVNQGEVLGFLGPNGAGKTTTIRQLMGFIRPQQGAVRIQGLDCFKEADKIQKMLGYLPGEIAFVDAMSGMEFIRFVAEMRGMKGLGLAPELMDRFELNASGNLKKMSKGMKQKIGLVCAFMDPAVEILILDEPTSGLDPLMQSRFVELILSEKKKGKTILMSSHMFEEIERTCDRAAIIREGRLVAVEEMEKLREGRQKVMVVTFQEVSMAADFAAEFPKASYSPGERAVTVKVGRNLDAFLKKASAYTIADLEVRTQNLEEFFMHFYGEGAGK